MIITMSGVEHMTPNMTQTSSSSNCYNQPFRHNICWNICLMMTKNILLSTTTICNITLLCCGYTGVIMTDLSEIIADNLFAVVVTLLTPQWYSTRLWSQRALTKYIILRLCLHSCSIWSNDFKAKELWIFA